MFWRILAALFNRSPYRGLIISPSLLVADGMVILKQAGREVGSGMLSELRRRPKGCDEIVVSPSDWHMIVGGRA